MNLSKGIMVVLKKLMLIYAAPDLQVGGKR